MARRKRRRKARSEAAVLYLRASTQKQEASVPDQRSAALHYAKQHDLDVDHEFVDDGIRGSDLSRPGLLALLNFVEATPGGTILCWDRSRLTRARDMWDGIDLERRIAHAGWKLVYLSGSQPTGDQFVDGIRLMYEHCESGRYSDRLAKNTLRGLVRRARAGFIGTKIPYGFAKEVTYPNGTTEVIQRDQPTPKGAVKMRFVPGCPIEVGVVREVFSGFARGGGYARFARELNARGVPSPGGKQWQHRTIRGMLTNPAYAGDLTWNRSKQGTFRYFDPVTNDAVLRSEEVAGSTEQNRPPEEWIVLPGHHHALVDRETYDRCQVLLAERAAAKRAGKVVPRSYPLTGLVRCAQCGAPAVGSTRKGKRTRRRRYVCSTYARGIGCEAWTVSADALETELLGLLSSQIRTVVGASMEAIKAKLRDRFTCRLGLGSKSLDTHTLHKQHEDLERQIQRATVNLGNIVENTAVKRLVAQIADWARQQEEIQDEIRALEATQRRAADVEVLVREALGVIEEILSLEADASAEAIQSVFQRSVASVRLEVKTERPEGWKKKRHSILGADIDVKPLVAECMEGGSGP